MVRTFRATLLGVAIALAGCGAFATIAPEKTHWLRDPPEMLMDPPPSPAGRLVVPYPVTFDANSEFDLRVYPDNGHAIFVSDRTGNWEVWAKPLDGSAPYLLVERAARESSPTLSPNGKFLVAVTNELEGRGDLIRINVDPNRAEKFIGTQSTLTLRRPGLEDANPVWLDNRRTLFSSRIDESWRLLVHDWKSRETRQISDGEVRAPALLQIPGTGRRILAFLRESEVGPSSLHIGEFVFEQDPAILDVIRSGGTAPVEGFPAWGSPLEDGTAWLYYSRWVDDTNLDGVITTDDNASIWRIRVNVNPGDVGPIGAPEPLTSGEFYDVSPQPSEMGVFYVREEKSQVGVFRLPLVGRAGGLEVNSSQLERVTTWSNPYERLLAYRWITVQAEGRGDTELAERSRFNEAGVLEELENLGSALVLLQQISARGNPYWASRAKLAILRLQAQVLKAADLGPEREKRLLEELQGYERAIRKAGTEAGGRLAPEALLELARIEMDFGFSLRAFQRIDEIEQRYAEHREVLATALIFKARIYRSRGNEPAARESLLRVIRDFSENEKAQQTAATRFLEGLGDSFPGPKAEVRALRDLLERYRGTPVLATHATLRIAALYEGMNLRDAAIREYQAAEQAASDRLNLLYEARLALLEEIASTGDLDATEQAFEAAAGTARLLDAPDLVERARDVLAATVLEVAADAVADGNLERATRAYELLVKKIPRLPEAHFGRIRLADQVRLDELAEGYQEQIAAEQEVSLAYYGLALVALNRPGPPDLSQILEKHVEPGIAKDFRVAALHHLKGYIHEIAEVVYRRNGPGENAGTLQDAVQEYQTALFLTGDRPRFRVRRAELYTALGNTFLSYGVPNYEGAWRNYQERIRTGIEFRDRRRELVFHERLAQAAFHTGRLEECTAAAAHAADIASTLQLGQLEARILQYRALCLQQQGNFRAAIEQIDRVEKLLETLPPHQQAILHRNRGYNLYRLNEWEESLYQFQQEREILQSSGFSFPVPERGKDLGLSKAEDRVEAFGIRTSEELRLNYGYSSRLVERLGHLGDAVEFEEQRVRLYQKARDRRGELSLEQQGRLAVSANRLGRLRYRLGDDRAAAEAFEETLIGARAAGQANGEAVALEALARLSLESPVFDAERVEKLGQQAAGLIARLEQRAGDDKGLDPIWLARAYHARALFRTQLLLEERRDGVAFAVSTLRDFVAAQYLSQTGERENGRGYAIFRVGVALNQVRFLAMIGMDPVASEQLANLAGDAQRFRLRCLRIAIAQEQEALGETPTPSARELARQTPPAFCRDVSGLQLRHLYERIYTDLLAQAGKGAESFVIAEEWAQLLLANGLAGTNLDFAAPLQSAEWQRISAARMRAQKALEELQSFPLIEDSVESQERLAELQRAVDKALAEFEATYSEVVAQRPALARLVRPLAVDDVRIEDAVEGAVLLRVHRSGQRAIIHFRTAATKSSADVRLSPMLTNAMESYRAGTFDADVRTRFLRFARSVIRELPPEVVEVARRNGMYVIADGDLAVLPWGALNEISGLERVPLAQVASAAHLLAAWDRRNAYKGQIVLVADPQRAPGDTVTWVNTYRDSLSALFGGVRAFYRPEDTRSQFIETLRDPTLGNRFLHVLTPFRVDAGWPPAARLTIGAAAGIGKTEFRLSDWPLLATQLNLAVFENIGGSLSGETFHALAYTWALSGMPSAVMERVSSTNPDAAVGRGFYEELYRQVLPDEEGRFASPAAALARIRQERGLPGDVRLIGHLGFDTGGATEFASEEAARLIDAALKAIRTEEFERASVYAERAVLLVDILRVPEEQLREVLNLAIYALKKSERIGRAIGYEERLVRILEENGEETQLVKARYFLAQDLAALERFEEAIAVFQKTLELARTLADPAFEIILLAELANTQKLAGQVQMAIASYAEALNLAHRSGNQEAAEELHYNLGRVLHERTGDETSAALHLRRALEVATKLNQERDAARDALTLVLVERSRGALRAALDAAETLIPLARGLDDPALLAQGLVYRGVVRRDVRRLRDAMTDLDEAISIAEKNELSATLLDARNSRALVLLDLSRITEAVAQARLVVEAANSEELAPTRAAALHNLALALLEQNEVDAAVSRAIEALELARRLELHAAAADELVLLARLDRREARPESAVSRMREAAALYGKANRNGRRLDCLVVVAIWTGQVPELRQLTPDALEKIGRVDLLWRVHALNARWEKAAEALLEVPAIAQEVEERQGFDPLWAEAVTRKAVRTLAESGEVDRAHLTWERYRLWHRRRLLAHETPPLDVERGRVPVAALEALWAEWHSRAAFGAQASGSLQEIWRDLAKIRGDLKVRYAATARLLYGREAPIVERQRELSRGDLIVDWMIDEEKPLAFLLTRDAHELLWLGDNGTEIAKKAGALRELIGAVGRYEEAAFYLGSVLIAPLLEAGVLPKEGGRLIGLLDRPLTPLSLSVLAGAVGEEISTPRYQATLSGPETRSARVGSSILHVLAIGDVSERILSEERPPLSKGRPSPAAKELWDAELFEISRTSGSFMYKMGGEGRFLRRRPTDGYLSVHCAAPVTAKPLIRTRCGRSGHPALPLQRFEEFARPPEMTVLPELVADSGQWFDLLLWLEWIAGGNGVVAGLDRIPVGGVHYSRALYAGLEDGLSGDQAHSRAVKRLRKMYAHPGYWGVFFYFGPVE